jgi:HEPN domain-containing protein
VALAKVSFPKTHDLIILKNLCVKCDGGFEWISDLAISLNPYAVEFRYPGETASPKDARRAFLAAKEIREFVRTKLKRARRG